MSLRSLPSLESLPADALAWYAIQVRSHCEFQAQRELSLRGFQSFLPVQKVRRKWSDRFRVIESPLFPGYLFGRFELKDRFRVLNLPGVARIVGSGLTPIPVGESEIHSIQALLNARLELMPWPYLEAGQTVQIAGGPLSGVTGMVVRADGDKPRVVVSVTLLQRSVSAEVDRDWITAVTA